MGGVAENCCRPWATKKKSVIAGGLWRENNFAEGVKVGGSRISKGVGKRFGQNFMGTTPPLRTWVKKEFSGMTVEKRAMAGKKGIGNGTKKMKKKV